MLIQAASGYGKSYAARRLIEITAGHVQQFVIDPDGEFASLREKHDFVIAAAHDGDALAHPRTAALLVRRLLETGVSAVLDIYDLKAHERHSFVRTFLQTMVDAPKSLWRPVLVLLDEAHVFCPEKGSSEAAGAVIDMATRGRKRGFGLVMATQRLSKLNKDAAAELLNKLIGMASLDVDVGRAADDLGMTKKEAKAALLDLNPGEFFAYGPALSKTVSRLKIGEVHTTHPKAGQRSLVAPPKPTAAIRAVLPQLADLPKEAEQELKTMEDLRRELATVRRELTAAKNATGAPSAEDLKVARDEGYRAGALESLRGQRALLGKLRGQFREKLVAVMELFDEGQLEGAPAAPPMRRPPMAPRSISPARTAGHRTAQGGADPTIGTSGGKYRIMVTLAQHGRMTERRLALLAGLSAKGGTWSTYLSALRSAGYIEGTGEFEATPAGIAALGHYEPLPSGEALIDYWRRRIGGGGRLAIFNALVEAYPSSIEQDALAAAVNLSPAGGTWSTYLSSLRTMELITGKRDLQAAAELFA